MYSSQVPSLILYAISVSKLLKIIHHHQINNYKTVSLLLVGSQIFCQHTHRQTDIFPNHLQWRSIISLFF